MMSSNRIQSLSRRTTWKLMFKKDLLGLPPGLLVKEITRLGWTKAFFYTVLWCNLKMWPFRKKKIWESLSNACPHLISGGHLALMYVDHLPSNVIATWNPNSPTCRMYLNIRECRKIVCNLHCIHLGHEVSDRAKPFWWYVLGSGRHAKKKR